MNMNCFYPAFSIPFFIQSPLQLVPKENRTNPRSTKAAIPFFNHPLKLIPFLPIQNSSTVPNRSSPTFVSRIEPTLRSFDLPPIFEPERVEAGRTEEREGFDKANRLRVPACRTRLITALTELVVVAHASMLASVLVEGGVIVVNFNLLLGLVKVCSDGVG
jgi:hypothetical protein